MDKTTKWSIGAIVFMISMLAFTGAMLALLKAVTWIGNGRIFLSQTVEFFGYAIVGGVFMYWWIQLKDYGSTNEPVRKPRAGSKRK